MKKRLITCLGITLLLSGSLWANQKPSPTIKLYANPTLKAKVLGTTTQEHALVPFHRNAKKQHWVKVGNSNNGQVGWVNLNQVEKFHQTEAKASTPDIQTFFISSETHTTGKDGKPVINVVAYKNGQKVSNKEAQKLYKKMRGDQIAQQHRMIKFNRDLERLYQRNFNRLNHGHLLGHQFLAPMPVLSPIVILEPQVVSDTSPHQSVKTNPTSNNKK